MPNLNYTIRIAIAGKRKHNGLTNLENDGRVEKILGILNEMHNKLLNKTANDKPTDDEKDIYNKIAPGSELKVQFLNGLAEGADQMVTDKIFKYNYSNPIGEELKPWVDAILPFSEDCFKYHPEYPLEDEKLTKFNELIGKCKRIICVNSKEVSEKICGPNYSYRKEADDRAFEAQALLMLRRCDILLAFTDPAEGVNPGGTMQTINKARAYHIPVIFVSLADNRIYVLDEDTTYAESLHLTIPRIDIKINEDKAIETIFKKIITNQLPDYPSGEIFDYEKITLGDPDYTFFNNGLGEEMRSEFWNSINKTLKENAENREILDKNKDAYKKHNTSFLGNLSASLRNVLSKRIWKPKPEKEAVDKDKSKIRILHENIDRANGLLANQYRGGYVLNNLLAVFAVGLAIIALLSLYFAVVFEKSELVAFTLLLLVLAIVKLFSISMIYKNTKTGHEKKWNLRSIQSRYLAERLRIFEYLFNNGITRGIKPSLGKHLNAEFQRAPSETIYRKIEGNTSFEDDKIPDNKTTYLYPFETLNQMNSDLVAGQIKFHTSSSKRMEILENFLDHTGKILNEVTIGIVIIDLIILFLSLLFRDKEIKECFSIIEWLHKNLAPFLIGITAFLPALVASFNTIRFQSEARKLKQRYLKMFTILTEKSLKINELLTTNNEAILGSGILDTYPIITEVEQIMLDEVSDWTLLYDKDLFEW